MYEKFVFAYEIGLVRLLLCIFATKVQKINEKCKYFIKYFTFITNYLLFWLKFRKFAG